MSTSQHSPNHAARGPLYGFAWVMTVLIAAPTASALDAPHHPGTLGTARITSRSASNTPKSRAPQVYLALIGPTPLRFADPSPGLPPEPVMPSPQLLPLNTPTLDPTGKHPGETPSTRPDATVNTPDSTPGVVKPLDLDPTETPQRIIPDDMRQEVRPEDVLPFFQLPSGGDVNGVVLPLTLPASRAPAPQPPSSATYRQQ